MILFRAEMMLAMALHYTDFVMYCVFVSYFCKSRMGLFYYFLPLCKFHDGLVSHSREKFDNENIPSGEVITLPRVYVVSSSISR